MMANRLGIHLSEPNNSGQKVGVPNERLDMAKGVGFVDPSFRLLALCDLLHLSDGPGHEQSFVKRTVENGNQIMTMCCCCCFKMDSMKTYHIMLVCRFVSVFLKHSRHNSFP